MKQKEDSVQKTLHIKLILVGRMYNNKQNHMK